MEDHKMTVLVSEEFMNAARKTLQELSEINNVVLDYSHDSIHGVEKILSLMHENYKKTKNKDGLRGISLACAAYIVETIKKNTGKGTWYRNDSHFGEDSFPFEWSDGNVIYPLAWCEKRLFDGESDDVWYKYESIILGKVEDKKKITI